MGELAGREVLDVGCGDGVLLRAVASRGARVTEIDADPAMVTAARRVAAEAGIDARLMEGRAERLPFADASFDVVAAITVLCFAEDAALLVREMARVLRPGGSIVIGELGRWSSGPRSGGCAPGSARPHGKQRSSAPRLSCARLQSGPGFPSPRSGEPCFTRPSACLLRSAHSSIPGSVASRPSVRRSSPCAPLPPAARRCVNSSASGIPGTPPNPATRAQRASHAGLLMRSASAALCRR